MTMKREVADPNYLTLRVGRWRCSDEEEGGRRGGSEGERDTEGCGEGSACAARIGGDKHRHSAPPSPPAARLLPHVRPRL